MRLKYHESSSRNLGAVNFFSVDSCCYETGSLIGRNACGGPFFFDPFEYYKQGIITNPNIIVIGQIGRGKSSFVKSFLYRQSIMGRKAVILDPKGEYSELVTSLGGTYVSAVDKSDSFNEKSESLELCTLSSKRVLSLVEALIGAKLSRNLTSVELAAVNISVNYCLEQCHKERTSLLLEHISQMLFETEKLSLELKIPAPELAMDLKEAAVGFSHLVESELKHLAGLSLDKAIANFDVVGVDLSSLYNNNLLGPVMAYLGAYLEALITSGTNSHGMYIVYDEAWALLNNEFILTWLRGWWKLARSYGVSNIAIFHRLSDLGVSKDVKTTKDSTAMGLISDSEVKVIFNQDSSESQFLESYLGLNRVEMSVILQLQRGVFLLKIAKNTYLIKTFLSNKELQITDSDQNMK